MQKRILVTGASGFIGHHLVNYLKKKGNFVRGVDWKKSEYPLNADEFFLLDLRDRSNAFLALKPYNGQPINEVYALAADMGGMGFIGDSNNQYKIFRNNALININTLDAALEQGVQKYLFSSSACVYPNYKQMSTDTVPLKETDAYPADPQDTYGWEKLMTEILLQNINSNMEKRIVRFHNIYGPEGAWRGGREKAPAALCRKVAEAKLQGRDYIEIWGDGEQTRSFCYIDDCIKGLDFVMNVGNYSRPVNLGRDEMISINQLADIICEIAGVKLKYKYVPGPQGVRGRNSDNTLFKTLYGWAPEIGLKEGLKKTYSWIEQQVLTESSYKQK